MVKDEQHYRDYFKRQYEKANSLCEEQIEKIRLLKDEYESELVKYRKLKKDTILEKEKRHRITVLATSSRVSDKEKKALKLKRDVVNVKIDELLKVAKKVCPALDRMRGKIEEEEDILRTLNSKKASAETSMIVNRV